MTVTTRPKSPRFSFIMPVRDQQLLTRDCLLSLWAYTAPWLADAEILIVDDASGSETAAFLDGLPAPVRVIRNRENLGFAAGNNLAVSQARGQWLVLINNDLVFQPGWFEALIGAALALDRPAVAGNVQLSRVSARVDHAGKFFDASGHPRHFGQFYPELFPWEPPVDFLDFPSVTAACWLVPRSLYQSMGGFDEGYRNGFEDDDFCMRASEAGYRVGVALRSRIYHHVSPSAGRKDREEANWQRFRAVWHEKALQWHDSRFAKCLNLLQSWTLQP
jgi:GT2 family glycosyltransferase